MRLRPGWVAGLAAAAGVVWYLQRPGRSVVTLFQEAMVLLGGIRLTEAQRSMVRVIEEEAARAGFVWLIPAAVANAYAESRLDPAAVGDGGRSIGLFQLNERGGGAGMSVDERKEPRANARRIFEIVHGPQGAPIRAAYGTASHRELAALFAQHAERCWACGYGGGSAQLTARADLVASLYGSALADSVA